MTHTCARCSVVKDLEDFRPTRGTGWEDESGRTRYSYCIDCERERNRAYQAKRRAQGKARPKNASTRPGWKRDLLPIQPFALWLRVKASEYGSAAAVAVATDLGERRIRGILAGDQQWVTLDTVDWALTHEESTYLFELYPDLYPGLDTQSLAEVLDATTVPSSSHEPWLVAARERVIA